VDSTSGTKSVPVDGFYRHMSDLGLRYGEEFRPIRELSAGNGQSAGRVDLSETVSPRAGEYALHPVLFDGAMQVFSAGAATVEGRQARMKLPVGFRRILFLGSPGPSNRVSAKVSAFGDDFLEGDIAIYNEQGKPCVLVDGFRAISLSGAGRSAASGGTRDLTYHVAWQRTLNKTSRSELTPVPLKKLHDAAQTALDRVIAVRGQSELETALCALDNLAASQLARGLSEMGVTENAPFDAASLHIAAPMRPVFERLMAGLVRRGLLPEKKKKGLSRHVILQKRRIRRKTCCAITSSGTRDIFPKRFFVKETALSWDRFCAVKRMPCRFCFPGSARSCSTIFTGTVFSPATGLRRSPRR
jgi:hypothetical protein